MKIAMIGQKGIPALFGGIERHVEELSTRLAARGHDVTVFTRPYFTSPSRRTYRQVHLVSLPSLRTKHFDAISHTWRALIRASREEYDVIHIHGVGPSLLSFIPRFLGSRARVVTTFHCLDRKHEKWGLIARLALRLGEWAAVTFPDRTIAVSRTIQRYAQRTYHRSIEYIPNGVSLPVGPTSRHSRTLARYGLGNGGYVLAVSRLIPHKGIQYLIRAFRQLPTNTRLVIVGGGFYTDEYVAQLHAMAKGDSRIIFTGPLRGRALHDIFAHAGVFVLPSDAEGLPIVLLEAAAYGLPILASNIPENLEVLHSHHPAIGMSFRHGNVRDLRRTLAQMLRHQRSYLAMGRRARRHVVSAYNWDTIVRQTENLYATATEPRTAKALPGTRRVLVNAH